MTNLRETLTEACGELERTDPATRAAVEGYDRMSERIRYGLSSEDLAAIYDTPESEQP